jgi:hypothetical protein
MMTVDLQASLDVKVDNMPMLEGRLVSYKLYFTERLPNTNREIRWGSPLFDDVNTSA